MRYLQIPLPFFREFLVNTSTRYSPSLYLQKCVMTKNLAVVASPEILRRFCLERDVSAVPANVSHMPDIRSCKRCCMSASVYRAIDCYSEPSDFWKLQQPTR